MYVSTWDQSGALNVLMKHTENSLENTFRESCELSNQKKRKLKWKLKPFWLLGKLLFTECDGSLYYTVSKNHKVTALKHTA